VGKLSRGHPRVDQVYGLAANMGGIGFIETHKAEIVRDSSLMNLHSIEAARQNGVQRYFYTSSACIYPGFKQQDADVTPLKEEDAYPADAEGRLWVGKALHGAGLPALHRRLRSGHASGAVP